MGVTKIRRDFEPTSEQKKIIKNRRDALSLSVLSRAACDHISSTRYDQEDSNITEARNIAFLNHNRFS